MKSRLQILLSTTPNYKSTPTVVSFKLEKPYY
jgi:hypothetical protein